MILPQEGLKMWGETRSLLMRRWLFLGGVSLRCWSVVGEPCSGDSLKIPWRIFSEDAVAKAKMKNAVEDASRRLQAWLAEFKIKQTEEQLLFDKN